MFICGELHLLNSFLEPVNSERAKIGEKGAIDQEKVRREVVDHMEGGDEPYLLRRDKLNVK